MPNRCTVYIDETQLNKYGTGTLLGTIAKDTGGSIDDLDHVVLYFPQSSLSKRQQQGGPDEWMLMEYNVPCLIKDVIFLVKAGVDVTVALGN